MTRAAYVKLSRPVAKAALRAGLTPDSITILGTAGTVLGALTLFPIGQLWWGAVVVSFFVLADMLDGAMARESGGGTRFGAVLDATCDRIGDGAVFCGLLWWAAFGLESASLVVATLICMITSQVISYIKARAEASGLRGDGGIIERPERLVIVLAGTGLSDLPFFPLPWTLHAAMWVLAVASVVTLLQRLHTVRTSPGAMEPLRSSDVAGPATAADNSGDKPEAWGHSPRERGAHPPGGQGDEP
jgi:CDP-diacylglycerol---glycerol-3-phosphate 3-phosphatidyltransferase